MSVDVTTALLCWYAVDKRQLPWRAEPGESADPYRVWLSEIMLQQTTVAAVKPYYRNFLARWPTLQALAEAEEAEVLAAWAGLGYYSRARNLHACARVVVADHDGRLPDREAALRRLPGIGAYTAAAIAAIAYGRKAAPVDANIERVVARLHRVAEPLPRARRAIGALAGAMVPDDAPGDFAQALMDLGSRICTPRAPRCEQCPIRSYCQAFAAGDQEAYPVKPKRKARPSREGIAYWLEHDGQVLLVRRPPRGLLGGMLALPTDRPPLDLDWQDAGAVSHVFTHFALQLRVLCATAGKRVEGHWHPVSRLGEAGLPTLFVKAVALGQAWRGASAAAPMDRAA